jgi:5-methylcytosine-specific restriction enzyme subunit McrC
VSDRVDIPIQNIYYLLCYAWRRLEERDLLALDVDDVTELVDLFGRVLLGGVRHLRRRGLDRGYLNHEERTSTIRGRVDLDRTVRENLLQHGRVCCRYDHLSHDVLHNRILRSTLEALVADPNIDQELAQGLSEALRWFAGVERVALTPSAFRKLQLHRNNSIYGFLMDICRLVMEQLLVSEQRGESLFRNFLRSDHEMRLLFEQFVRNFYHLELSDARVSSKKLAWDGTAGDDTSAQVLPGMITDVTIERDDHVIILDTKYTPKALVMAHHGGGERLRTEHLYQLFAYVRNAEALGGKWETCEGVLLYPSVAERFRFEFEIAGHRMKICSVNLAADWGMIREELVDIARLCKVVIGSNPTRVTV